MICESIRAEEPKDRFGFLLYLVFTVSWFLHFGLRLPFLGTIRFDFLLVLVLIILSVFSGKIVGRPADDCDRALRMLIAFCILTIPFVEWPGSVISRGLEQFLKAIVFFYFTIFFVTSESRLKIFVYVFIVCQSFRVAEPLYLHLTSGYWGSIAMMGNEDFMNRLSGAPSDIVNPNGLAYIILTVLPFLYYLFGRSVFLAVLRLGAGIAFIYALVLTGSRSGFVGLVVGVAAALLMSRRKVLLAPLFFACLVALFAVMPSEFQERYTSIFSSESPHYGTAQGRLTAVWSNLALAMRKPLFGHGLGTSLEVNYNFSGSAMWTHDLYAEVAQELGLVGLGIFLLFMKTIAVNFVHTYRLLKSEERHGFQMRLLNAMVVWFSMTLLFSFFSYGLSSYEWYLFGGLSAVLRTLTQEGEIAALNTLEGPEYDPKTAGIHHGG